MKDTEGHHSPEPDLIDRIANALPAEVRADYYRELTHCRSLPENDEMLRILRAILFLALLMEQVPSRVVAERERLEQLFHTALDAFRQMHAAALSYQSQLDQRLACLPEHVAMAINPEAIVAGINESLRQQFAKSTLPQTAEALGVVSASTKKTAAEFARKHAALGTLIVVRRRRPAGPLAIWNRPFPALPRARAAPQTIWRSHFTRSIGGRSIHSPA